MKKALVLSSLLALCTSGQSAWSQELKIGLATAQTGRNAACDVPIMEGIHVATDEINAAGGIGGKYRIRLISKDVRSEAAQTAIATQELVDQNVSVIVLPCDADPAFAAIPVVQAAKIAAISTASPPTLPLIGGDYMFINFPADNIQATVSAEWAAREGLKSGYILYSPDSQYSTLPLYFKEVFLKLGGRIVGESTYSIGQEDFSAIVTRIAALDPQPEFIMTAAMEPEFPSLLKTLRAAGVKSRIIGSDGLDSPATFSLGDLVQGTVFTAPGFATPGSPMERFNRIYKKKMGKESETSYNAIGYDTIKIIEAAVKKAGSTDPQAIRDALANLENVQGATGLITYKGTDGAPIVEVSLIRMKAGGARELIGRFKPSPELVPEPRMQ